MFADETLTWWWPFRDAADIPEISVAGSEFVPMVLDISYKNALPAEDPDKTATWCRYSFAGPDSEGAGNITVTVGWHRVVFRVVSGSTVDVKPDPDEAALWLVVATR